MFFVLRSADQSPNKIILTEQKLEERKRWNQTELGVQLLNRTHELCWAIKMPFDMTGIFREMELKRRKKKEETTSTENKIEQMKVLPNSTEFCILWTHTI